MNNENLEARKPVKIGSSHQSTAPPPVAYIPAKDEKPDVLTEDKVSEQFQTDVEPKSDAKVKEVREEEEKKKKEGQN
ncbi:hypothetical protein G7054_g2401 [Neopestalotiopsis clavispora]|nr:hypothetical protein G7054_g2401 [Neopestalotiopsis clavispora]